MAPGDSPPPHHHDGGHDVFALVAQMGAMSRIGSGGGGTRDLLLALFLPLFLRWFGLIVLDTYNKRIRNRTVGDVRVISHTVSNTWYHWRGSQDQDAEEAPNSVIQRAILTYINKTMPEITRHWTSAEVEARRATRNLAKAANNDDDCGSTDSDEEGDEAPQYHYLVSPPPEQFVQITADVELMVEDVRRAQENNNNGGNSNQKDRTIVFTLRSMKPKSAQLIEDFIQRALDFHNQRLKDSIDSARYLYVPVLGGGKSGEDGGSGAKVSYHRYRLDEQRTFESFFHPEKQGVINLVQAFQNKTGKFSIPGYPQKLGFLLHGPPGTGKTSFIKALAQHTGRHIVSIPLSRIKTNQELMDLMTEQRVHLLGADDSTAPSTLPFKKVIYVMEDVDAASQVVRRRVDAQSPTPARMTNPAVSSLEGCELPQRDVLSPSTPPLPQGGTATPSAQAGAACREPSLGPSPLEMQLLITQMQLQEKLADKQAGSSEEEIQVLAAGMEMGPVAPNSKSGWYKDLLKGSSDDKLNLAGLLNTLDGVVDTPERIVVMTTNWPEHLDPALIRPGRINKQIYLGHLRVEEALMMINHYFVVDHAAGKADAEAGDAAMVPDAASDAGQAQMAAELRGIWMDGQVTPAELECMCAEHDNLAGLLEALRARFIGCQQ